MLVVTLELTCEHVNATVNDLSAEQYCDDYRERDMNLDGKFIKTKWLMTWIKDGHGKRLEDIIKQVMLQCWVLKHRMFTCTDLQTDAAVGV